MPKSKLKNKCKCLRYWDKKNLKKQNTKSISIRENIHKCYSVKSENICLSGGNLYKLIDGIN